MDRVVRRPRWACEVYAFNMVVRVQHVDGEFRVVLTAEAMAALHLEEGAAVEVRPIAGANGAGPKIVYVTMEEGLRAFYDTLPQHEAA